MNVVQKQTDENCSRWSRLLIIVAFKLGDRIIGDFQLEAPFLSCSLLKLFIEVVFKVEKRNQGCLLEVAHQKRASFLLRFWAANVSFHDADHSLVLLLFVVYSSPLNSSGSLSLSLFLGAGFESAEDVC